MTHDELSERCVESTYQAMRHAPRDDQFCFELLFRALGQQLEDALTRVYQVYLPLAIYWAENHPRFLQTRYPADEFATIGMSNFFFATRAEKFRRFPNVPALMGFLKMCIGSEIAQHLRKSSRVTGLSGNMTSPAPSDTLFAQIWQRICDLLPDPLDQVLANCVFVQELKPAEIVTTHGQYWSTPREISVALQRIRRRLRADKALCELLSL